MQILYSRSICLLIILISFTCLSGQTVEKIIQNYILIDSDQGLGKIGDSIQIVRQKGDEAVEIGRAKIIRFQDGKTAAEVSPDDVARIQIGDRAEGKKEVTEKRQIPVLRVVQDMVLLDGRLSLKENTPLEVYRMMDDSFQKIGTLSFMMVKDDKTVGKIVETVPGQEIKPGDRVIIPNAKKPSKLIDPDLDIDTYFFGDFEPE